VTVVWRCPGCAARNYCHWEDCFACGETRPPPPPPPRKQSLKEFAEEVNKEAGKDVDYSGAEAA
jgi:hypothetical protein